MNEFLDQFNSYPLGQKILGFVIVLITVFVGFEFVMYGPLRDKIDNKESRLTELQQEQEKLEKLKRNQAKVLNKVEELQAEILIAKEKLPSSAEIPRLLQLLHEKAKTAGLEIQNFQRKNDQEQKFYIEIPVQMQLKGTYGELSNFFHFVSRMNRIVNIRNLDMKLGGKENRGDLVVSALATTYRYKSEESEKGK